MTRNCMDPRPGAQRDTIGNSLLIAAVFVLYAALLIGTSEIIANPAQAQVELRPDAFTELLFGNPGPFPRIGPASTVRLNAVAN